MQSIDSKSDAASPQASLLVTIVIFGLFVYAALHGALTKDVTRGFDEVAHVSYVAHIQKTGDAWPRLETMRLLDPKTFQFRGVASYLNHPSPYYWMLARIGPRVEGHPESLTVLRLVNVAIAAMGFAALLMLGRVARLGKLEAYAWIVPLFATPALAPLAGSVNNDNLCVAGGAVALLSAWRMLETGRSRWLFAALAGLIVAGLAKLTGLLLVGGMMGGVALLAFWRGRAPFWWIAATLVAGLIASAPYLVFYAQYGALVPETPGQIALLKSTAPEEIGWEHAPRLSFPAYAASFAGTFIAQWMPTLADRNALQYAMLAAPVFALICAAAGLYYSARRLRDRATGPADILVVAGFAALGFTLLCHLVFSYRHHIDYAYIADAYPRYYLPLMAIVPLAGLSLLKAMRSDAARSLVATLLIAGPVALSMFGAP